jgi:ankyrin repeat protein
MIAARDGRLDLVQLLLSYGADATLHDLRGFTAINFVKGKSGTEYRAIERLLRQAVSRQGRGAE